MSRTWKAWAVLTAVTLGVGVRAETTLRRESSVRFAIDEAFQADGGVQYFFELAVSCEAPLKNETFMVFRAFDSSDAWKEMNSAPHLVMSRISYTVDKDITFFTEARARDLRYINAVADEMEVTANDDGTFRVGRMPSNTFRIEYFDQAKVKASTSAAVQALVAGERALPEVVLLQENSDFSRIMAMRTAHKSLTWTAHYRLAPGKTRLVVYTMSYLYTLPPFFLGGEDRVLQESLQGTRTLIERMRAYREPDAGR